MPPASKDPLQRIVAYDFLVHAGESRFRPSFESGPFRDPAVDPLSPGQPAWLQLSTEPGGSPPVVRAALGWYPLRVERRRALYAPTAREANTDGRAPAPCEYEFAFTGPPEALLEFRYGLLTRASDAPGPGVRFTVEAETGDGSWKTIFSTVTAPARPFPFSSDGRFYRLVVRPFDVGMRPPGDSWHSARVDVSAWKGRPVRIRFRTEALPEKRKSASPGFYRALWADPVLLAPRPSSGVRQDDLVLIVMESLRWDSLKAHGSPAAMAPRIDLLASEGMDFQRTYTNAVTPRWAIPVLLTSQRTEAALRATASLALLLKAKGYRTAAFGDLSSWLSAAPDSREDGFDEIHLSARGGYEPVHTIQSAVDWLAAQNDRSPSFLFIYVKDSSHEAPPPLRFWIRTLTGIPWGADRRAEWRYHAQAAYIDHYIGRFLAAMDLLGMRDRAVLSLTAIRGASFPRSPAAGFSEPEIRIPWLIRHRTLKPGQKAAVPSQLLDIMPTLLKALGHELPAGLQGQALHLQEKASDSPATSPTFLTHGERGKALVWDGHYKYICRRLLPARETAEEIYDLWADPRERHNLARQDRALLARLRRAMNELSPDRSEIRLVFWDLQGQSVQGTVACPGGIFSDVSASGSLSRAGPNEFRFEVASSSGSVRFETVPPDAAFILRMTLDQKPFPKGRLRISKFGLPFSELGGEEWFDQLKSSWMDGLAEPWPGESGPLAFLGRRPVENDPGGEGRSP
ncbi:MAG: sulfatase-like hydrolase/transferase [Elusimicrobia bacterium]|nr:sulfatase-like hydrolase/transferase [Elusimicrobiota bacterium]